MGFQATILTLFPEMFPGPLGHALAGKALEAGQWSCDPVNIRDFTENRHNKVDEMPYGGGAGLVMSAQPVDDALSAVAERPGPLVFMTPRGQPLTQQLARDLSAGDGVKVLCGRYEGFDQRVIDILEPLEISIGDFILNGGEVAAMVLVDSLVRMIPGVLGDEKSSWDDSFSRGNRLLEYPQYTRPREFEGRAVPPVLLGGNHEEIQRWRRQKSLENTSKRRSDLLTDSESTDP